MKTKFAIRINNIKDDWDEEREDSEKYYYDVEQRNLKKYVYVGNIEISRQFKTSQNAKIHLQKLVDTCVNINSRSGYTIVEVDEKNKIVSEEPVNIKRLSEELISKTPKYKGTDYYIDKLSKVMERLKISDYDYNWDKCSAFIKFTYKNEFYKFDHSISDENKLKFGTDCFAQLVLTLEDLARMSERNIYDFSVWISGMKCLPEKKLLPQCFINLGFKYDYPTKDELDQAYKKLLKIVHPDNGGDNKSFIILRESYEECLIQLDKI